MEPTEICREFAVAILQFPPSFQNRALELIRAAYLRGASDYERAARDVKVAENALRNQIYGS